MSIWELAAAISVLTLLALFCWEFRLSANILSGLTLLLSLVAIVGSPANQRLGAFFIILGACLIGFGGGVALRVLRRLPL